MISELEIFFPDIAKKDFITDGPNETTNNKERLRKAFDILIKPNSKVKDINDNMKIFRSVMKDTITPELYTALVSGDKQTPETIAARYVFKHHPLNKLIQFYGIRDETRQNNKEVFEFFRDRDFDKAMTEEINKLEAEKKALQERQANRENRYDKAEEALMSVDERWDKLESKIKRFEEMHNLQRSYLSTFDPLPSLNRYKELVKASKEAVNQYKAHRTPENRHKRYEAKQALAKFKKDVYNKLPRSYKAITEYESLLQERKQVIKEFDEAELQDIRLQKVVAAGNQTVQQRIQELDNLINMLKEVEPRKRPDTSTFIERRLEFLPVTKKDECNSLEEWLDKYQYKELHQPNINKKIEDFKAGRKVVIDDMNKFSRQQFTEKLIPVMEDMVNQLDVRDSVQIVYHTTNPEVRKYTKDTFKEIINQWKQEGFILKDDNVGTFFYEMDGKPHNRPALWTLNAIQCIINKSSAHSEGGNFCPYILCSDDPAIIKYCREKIQLADHVPQPDEDDLLEPCLIHALCESAENITPRQKGILRRSLRSRCLTRFIPVASIQNIAREFSLNIIIYDIDERPLHKFLSGGAVYKHVSGEGWVRDTTAKIHNWTGDTTTTRKDIECKICLWEDHYFAREAAETLRDLIDEHKLIPMTYSANYIFKQLLPNYTPEIAEYQHSMFMTPQQTLDNFNYTYKHIDTPQLGMKMLLEYLIKNNINMYSMSGTPKKYIQQSVRGGKVSIANGKQCLINEPVTGLDVNSLYPYAMSEIPAPIGYPRYITKTMTLNDLKQMPIYFVRVYVKAYHKQHELDVPLTTGFHVFNNYDLEYLPIEIDESYGISGFYWDKVEQQAFKNFINELYKQKVEGNTEAKRIMNEMIGCLAKKPPETYDRLGDRFNDHPLLKRIKAGEDRLTFKYYTPLDYQYNFMPIYSLILSKAKMHMEQLFRECHNKGIKMYCTSTDSLYIRSKDVPKLSSHIDAKALGKLKVEAEADKACFAGYRLYALGNTKIILTNQSGKEFRDKHGENSFNVFVQKYFKGGHVM